MKNNEATIFVFIASIIIGLLIAMNIGFEGKNNFLDAKQYDEAYNERTNLYSELNNLKEQYYKINVKLKKYTNGDEVEDEVLAEIKKEISYNNLILGNSDVEGQGVKITLEDGDDPNMDMNVQIVHDSDIGKVINDLKNAGAESISVNGHRIVYDNYVLCGGPFIYLNGIKIVTPFYINSIGNQDLLYNYLTLEPTQIKLLKIRSVKVSIVKSNKIKILAYTGKFKYEYMSPITK
ncbi:MAG: hypothetical protein ACI8WT_000238 [Clostridium sp.]|jgi:uncharacterized protein YlxW (UPF0749 family)